MHAVICITISSPCVHKLTVQVCQTCQSILSRVYCRGGTVLRARRQLPASFPGACHQGHPDGASDGGRRLSDPDHVFHVPSHQQWQSEAAQVHDVAPPDQIVLHTFTRTPADVLQVAKPRSMSNEHCPANFV